MRWLAFAGFVAVFTVLCWDAGQRMPEAYPSVARCQSDPARYAGRQLWIIPGKILASDPTGFVLTHAHGRVRVHSNLMPPAGAYAFIRATFQADGTLLATGVDVDPNYLVKRTGILFISMITLLFFALLFHRTFQWRNGALAIR